MAFSGCLFVADVFAMLFSGCLFTLRQPENHFIVVPHSLIQRWLALLYYLYYLRLATLYKTV